MFTIAKSGERLAAAVLPDGYRAQAEALGDDWIILDGDSRLPKPTEISKVKGGGFIAKSHSGLLKRLITAKPKPAPKPAPAP